MEVLTGLTRPADKDPSNDEEAVVVPPAAPGPDADKEEDEEAVVVPVAAPDPGADREEDEEAVVVLPGTGPAVLLVGAGEEIVVPGLLAPLPDTSNEEEAVMISAAAPGPGADREEAGPGAVEGIVVPSLFAPPPLLLRL